MIPGALTLTESRAHLAASLAKMADRCACGYHVATQGCHCDGSEWAIFTTALRSAVDDSGYIHQRDVRPKLRGRIEPKHIGLAWKRARREGLIAEDGFERSDDTEGRNGHRMEARYRWLGGAGQVAA